MPIRIDEDVFGLEVPVHVAQGMDVVDSQQNLYKAGSCLGLLHVVDLFQLIEQLPSRAVLQDEYVELLGLDELVCLDGKRIVKLLTDNLLVVKQVWPFLRFSLDELGCKKISTILSPDQEHFAKASNGQALDHLILLQTFLFDLFLNWLQGDIFFNSPDIIMQLVVKGTVGTFIADRYLLCWMQMPKCLVEFLF